jgi:hypothetical protein
VACEDGGSGGVVISIGREMVTMTKHKQAPVARGRNYLGASEKNVSNGNDKSNKPTTDKTNIIPANEFKLFIAIVYAEANTCSEAAWRAVGHVIMNRVGNHEWLKLKTVTAIVTQKNGFEAYKNKHFNLAEKYLNDKSKEKSFNKLIDRMIEVLKPVYDKTDPDNTSGSVLYFSPKAQKALGRNQPVWASSNKLIEIKVDGLEVTDDFRFYKYKSKPKSSSKKSQKRPKKARTDKK